MCFEALERPHGVSTAGLEDLDEVAFTDADAGHSQATTVGSGRPTPAKRIDALDLNGCLALPRFGDFGIDQSPGGRSS